LKFLRILRILNSSLQIYYKINLDFAKIDKRYNMIPAINFLVYDILVYSNYVLLRYGGIGGGMTKI